MQLFTGLQYLQIDIANSAGQDKLNFEDRLTWFEENIPESVVTLDNKELLDFCMTIADPDSLELLYTGLLAYQDYWHKRPSGYLCRLDAVCSGISLMSCLTADISGLTNTGLLGNKRADLYSAVYKTFLEKYGKECKRTRNDVKQACMTFSYGSKKIPMEVFGESEEMFTAFYEALNQEANGAVQLQELLINTWNSQATKHTWIMPDGFNVYLPVMVEKQYTYTFTDSNNIFEVPYTIKELGTKKKSVSNCACSIHSIDGMLVREMARRCMNDKYLVQEVLWSLKCAEYELPEAEPVQVEELKKLGKLGELIYLYEQSKFCSIRIIEYINSKQSAQLLSKTHRSKLISILEKVIKHGYIEMVAIHDSFSSTPNNMNYIRYWYKEMCADIIDSNMLPFLYNQITDNKITEPVSITFRKQVAEQVRQSSYGLC